MEQFKQFKIIFHPEYMDELKEFVSVNSHFRKDMTNRVEQWEENIRMVHHISIFFQIQNGKQDVSRNYIGPFPHRHSPRKTDKDIFNIKMWDLFRQTLVPTQTTLRFLYTPTLLLMYVSCNRGFQRYNIPRGCSFVSMEFFDIFCKSQNIEIQHAMNGGEFKERKENGYFWPVDGYHHCEKHRCVGTSNYPCRWYNFVFEFQGVYWHKNKRQQDIEKNRFYIRKGYKWFEMREEEWILRKKTLNQIRKQSPSRSLSVS